MPIGGAVFVDGQYTITWNALPMGIMVGDEQSPTIEQQSKAKPINNTDAYGDSTIDAIYRGADWFAQYTCMEFKASTIAAFWPFNAVMGIMGVIGRLYSNLAMPLVLTAITGTPAATSPATLTAPLAILAPGYNTKLLYGPTLRMVPIRQILLPSFVTPNNVWITQT